MQNHFHDREKNPIEITQTNRKDWVPYLVLVMSNPHRLLGICKQPRTELEEGRVIHMEHVCTYASQLSFQPAPDGKGARITGPRLIIPFDGVAPLRWHDAHNYTGISWLAEEPEDSPLRALIVGGYVALFDQSRLAVATPAQVRDLNS